MKTIKEKYGSMHHLCWWEDGCEFSNMTGAGKTIFSPSRLYLVYFHMNSAVMQRDFGFMSYRKAKWKVFLLKLIYRFF